MKKLVLVFALGLGTVLGSFAQNRNLAGDRSNVQSGTRESIKDDRLNGKAFPQTKIPKVAEQHFFKNFGSHSAYNWQMGNDGLYSRIYNEGDLKFTAYYDQFGHWYGSERKIGKRDVPLAVSNAFYNGRYGRLLVREFKFLKNPTYKSGVYVVVAQERGKLVQLYYNTAGRLMKVV